MRVCYINLAARTDRRGFMESQFAALGLAATRVEALTPDDLTAADRDVSCNPARGYWLTPRELSCSLSHLAAMRGFLDTDGAHCAIFEDDVRLSHSLPRFLHAFEARPPAVDILRIETYLQPLRLLPSAEPGIAGFAILEAFSWAAGAAGYIVNRRAAEWLVASRDFRIKQTDRVMFNPYERLPRRMVMRHLDPGLCVQLKAIDQTRPPALSSEIDAERASRGQAERAHFWRRIPHAVADTIETEVVIATQKHWHQFVRGAKKRRIDFRPD